MRESVVGVEERRAGEGVEKERSNVERGGCAGALDSGAGMGGVGVSAMPAMPAMPATSVAFTLLGMLMDALGGGLGERRGTFSWYTLRIVESVFYTSIPSEVQTRELRKESVARSREGVFDFYTMNPICTE